MKILYISPNGYLGGAERFVCNILEGHLQNNNSVHEVIFFTDGEAANLCRSIGAKVHILPIQFKMRNPIKLLKVFFYMRKFIKENNFKLIHSTMPYAQIIAFFSTLFLDVKRVWFQHGPVGGLLDKIANLLIADRIYFNSKYLEEEHLKMFLSKRNIKKHKIINYGILNSNIDINEAKKIKNQYLKNAKYLFLSAGRLCPWKGQLELIQAILLLKNEDSDLFQKVKFLIVGSFGRMEDKKYEDEIKRKIKEEKLEKNIFMIGHKNNIQDYYNACDVFIHTSLIPEPFGLVVAESMKNNCLVIGSDQGGVKDILIDKETGFTYSSTTQNSQFALAKVISKVFNALERDINGIEQIKNNAKMLINTDYTVEKMTIKLEEDYKSLLS